MRGIVGFLEDEPALTSHPCCRRSTNVAYRSTRLETLDFNSLIFSSTDYCTKICDWPFFLSSNKRIFPDTRPIVETIKRQTEIRVAVWLQAKVRDGGLGLLQGYTPALCVTTATLRRHKPQLRRYIGLNEPYLYLLYLTCYH